MPYEPSAHLPNIARLTSAARATASHAYAKYSGFHVGAALLLSNGEFITGVNVENGSYGLTICAERSALVAAVSLYGPRIRVAAAVVVNLNEAASPPCGACRQVLSEFMDSGAPIAFPMMSGGQIQQVILPFGELLPHAFVLQKQ